VAEPVTGIPAAEIERTAQTLWEARPLAFYAWSGLEQHSNTTQTIRAINQLYALLGVSEAAQSLVQLRRPLVPPRGESRSDLQIVFALAPRLGLGEHFRHGDVDAAWRHQLAPSGLTLDKLRAELGGVRVPLPTRHRKYAEVMEDDVPRGFATSSRKIELYSEELAVARTSATARVRGIEHQPPVAARPRRALSPRAHLREVAVVL
jgi:anaerobic selenocysteine-containing dehydrogenase